MANRDIGNEAKNESETSVRSVNSDLETVPSSVKRRGSKASSIPSEANNSSTIKNASNRPLDYAFAQQKLYGWQPILTPYNVLPVLFVLGLIFVPLGAVFLSASFGVTEITVPYNHCKVDSNCVIELDVKAPVKGPVFVYYKLTNYYQNNRLYAKSFSNDQLKGAALSVAQLASSCDPLVGSGDKPYYPCGLIANSFFSDIFTKLTLVGSGQEVKISGKDIAWEADKKAYGKSSYNPENVLPPPSWLAASFPEELRTEFNIKNGKYEEMPNLADNERFINWMKVAGFPTFRKLYGKIDEGLSEGKYELVINSNYDVDKFGGTKSVVLSTTTWAGGKNNALGWSFIVIGAVLLALGIFFLVMFMMSPRKVGDVSYLSWYNENLADIIDDIQ